MRQSSLTTCSLILLSICLFGCVSDISHNLRYPTDYVVGQIYRLKQPVYAVKADMKFSGNETNYSGLTLYSVDWRQDWLPSSIEEYEKDKGAWIMVAGLAERGTLIRISEIQLENDFEMGRLVWIKGRLIDVPWAEKKAELAFISRDSTNCDLVRNLPVVNTNFLEVVTKP